MTQEPRDVVVTGLGPVTSIGIGREALWEALSRGRSNVTKVHVPVDLGRLVEVPMARMPEENQVPGLSRHLSYLSEQESAGSRELAYSLLAIELAVADARLDYERDRNTIGVIQVFEAPGVERAVSRLFEMMTMPPPPHGPPPVYDLLAPYFYNMQPFVPVHLISKAFGFRGFSSSVHNACSSGAFALEIAAQRIRAGHADVMIVAGGEAFDTGVRLEWFRRLDLYAPDHQMRPFDAEPSGFFVGEGAGAIVLEGAEHASRRGANGSMRYLGGGFAHQGWKQVIPDVRAARLRDVIRHALEVTGVSAGDLDLIVPHGAATQLSDGYESTCLAEALQAQRDHALATTFKPYFGHMLAASGIIEVIAMILAVQHQTVPAALHTRPDRCQFPVPLASKPTERPMRTALKLSTGFTGHDAATLFQAG